MLVRLVKQAVRGRGRRADFLRGALTTTSAAHASTSSPSGDHYAFTSAFAFASLLTVIASSSCAASDGLSDDKCEASNFDLLMRQLVVTLRPDQINIDPDDCKQRGKPWSSYHKCDKSPQVILLPESTADVSAIMRLCNEHRVPVVPFGGGTSLEGQILAPSGGICLDFNNMKK